MTKAISIPIILMLAMSLACTVSGVSIPSFGERISGSGDIVEVDQDFSDFDSLRVSSAFDVEVNQGNAFSVVIRIDDNLIDHLDVRLAGDELRIGLEEGNYNYDATTLEAEVTLPVLSAIDLNQASRAVLNNLSSNSDFNVDISSAGRLSGAISARNANFDVSGAGSVDLSGSATHLDVDASSASNIDLAEFEVGSVSVKAEGASTVVVNATDTLDVDASSASKVEYLGDPTLGSVELSGAASLDER